MHIPVHQNGKLFAIVAAAIAGCADVASSDRVVSAFAGQVIDVSDDFTFQLDCCDDALTLGLVTVDRPTPNNLAAIRTVMLSKFLRCTVQGRDAEKNATRVWCNTETGSFLSAELLANGLVSEQCDISQNQFGTC